MANVFVLGKKLSRVPFSQKNIFDCLRRREKVWIDLADPTKEEIGILRQLLKLHPVTVEDILSHNTRIKVEAFKNYLFIVFSGASYKNGLALTEIEFIIGNNILVSTHRGHLPLFEELMKDQKRVAEMMRKGVDFLLYKLVDMEVDNYYPFLESFDDYIEAIEKEVSENPKHEVVAKIMDLQRKITLMKKVALPEREKLSLLARGEMPFISKESVIYFRDVYDDIVLITEEIENHREVLTTTFEIYMSALSNRLNEIMKVLSIITTVMLPLTFITGIYGMNFANLPGLTHPQGFWVIVIIMCVMLVVMLLYFRMKEWI